MRIHRLVLGVFLWLVGCGEPARHEVVMADSVRTMNALVDVLASVRSDRDMPAATQTAQKLQADWRRLVRETRDLGKAHPELYLYFEQQGGELQRASNRCFAEIERIRKIAGSEPFVTTISAGLNPDKP